MENWGFSVRRGVSLGENEVSGILEVAGCLELQRGQEIERK